MSKCRAGKGTNKQQYLDSGLRHAPMPWGWFINNEVMSDQHLVAR